MLMITELLTPTPGPLWRLVKQAGIDHVVTLLDGGEQLWRWPEPGQEDGPPPFEAPPRGERAWDRPALARLQAAYREYGLELAVIEDTAPMDAVRLGTAGRDEQISWLHDQIRAMGELGIGTLCYNWHAVTGWARTHHDVSLRGGARSGGYDDATMRRAAPVAEPGSISTEQLWAAHEYFLRAPWCRWPRRPGCASACTRTIRRCPRCAACRGSWARPRPSTGCWRPCRARTAGSPCARATSP
jgi:mannonate dehydratase